MVYASIGDYAVYKLLNCNIGIEYQTQSMAAINTQKIGNELSLICK